MNPEYADRNFFPQNLFCFLRWLQGVFFVQNIVILAFFVYFDLIRKLLHRRHKKENFTKKHSEFVDSGFVDSESED